MPVLPAVAIIEWNTTGHHPTYLREYVLAFAEKSIPVIVLSPDPPAIYPLPAGIFWRAIPTMSWIKSRRLFTSQGARWLYARRLSRILRKTEAELGLYCQRVFFGCFHESQSLLTSRIMLSLNRPSAGLYVQAGIFHRGTHRKNGRLAQRVRRLLRQPLLEAIFMLDEFMAPEVAAFSGKPVLLLPDVTDGSIDATGALPLSLGLHPKRRPVLGLLGHLHPGKGISEMLAFARSEPDLDVTFLLAGSCHWPDFPTEEEKFIRQTCAEDSRIILHLERIPSEASYNTLVETCDVLWAVYRNSPHSSNTLAKAALFERPVIVADGFLIAHRTRRYSLGEIVPPDDAQALHDALLPMLTAPSAWREKHTPRWAAFREDHSNKNFRSRLGNWAVGVVQPSNTITPLQGKNDLTGQSGIRRCRE